ncbi:MAG: hypothetical protein ACI9UU_002720 [Candidatus Azotimanducaceae bacterium]|jgi:hypothetical protein
MNSQVCTDKLAHLGKKSTVMDRGLASRYKVFQAEVVAFLEQRERYPANAELWQDPDWLADLAERGWQAPSWPRSFGGSGFDATEKFIWYQSCRAAINGYQEPPALAWVGPMIAQHGSDQDRARYLPAILDGTMQFCTALNNSELPQIQCENGRWYVDGRTSWVEHVDAAGHLFGLAGENKTDLHLFSLNLDRVTIEKTNLLSGSEAWHIKFDHTLLGDDDFRVSVLAQEIETLPATVLGRSGVVAAQFEALERGLAAMSPEADIGSPDSDIGSPNEDIGRRKIEAAVEQRGLQALELRYVDALQRHETPPFPIELLAVKAFELERVMGTLLMDSFGYYALPYPDMWLQHNEGRVGPQGAREATGSWLEITQLEKFASAGQDLYGKLAQEIQERGEH